MRSRPVGLDVWFLVGPFVYFNTSWLRTAKALARLRGCAGLPEPSLVAYVTSTIISWVDPIIICEHGGVSTFLSYIKTSPGSDVVCMCEGPKSLHILYQSADYSLWSAMQIIFSGYLGSVGSRLFYLFIFLQIYSTAYRSARVCEHCCIYNYCP